LVGCAVAAQQSPQPSGSPVISVPWSPSVTNPALPSQTAVSVKQVESPAAPANYSDQAIWALMGSLVIQWLKRSAWFGWITEESTKRLKTQFGFLVAIATTAGIHFAVTGNPLSGGGAAVTITGLSFNALKDVAWQWSAQQAWYRSVVKEAPATVTVAKEKTI
jgi:hypothetical protein